MAAMGPCVQAQQLRLGHNLDRDCGSVCRGAHRRPRSGGGDEEYDVAVIDEAALQSLLAALDAAISKCIDAYDLAFEAGDEELADMARRRASRTCASSVRPYRRGRPVGPGGCSPAPRRATPGRADGPSVTSSDLRRGAPR